MKFKIKIFSIVSIIVLCFLTSKYCFQLILIQGNSMLPSYHNFEFSVINKLTKSYSRNDVVAFYCPSLNSTLVKRIVGTPGDTLIIKGGKLYINNQLFTNNSCYSDINYSGILDNPITLKENEYIVLGDNINLSKDSRYDYVGVISESEIIGVLVRKY